MEAYAKEEGCHGPAPYPPEFRREVIRLMPASDEECPIPKVIPVRFIDGTK